MGTINNRIIQQSCMMCRSIQLIAIAGRFGNSQIVSILYSQHNERLLAPHSHLAHTYVCMAPNGSLWLTMTPYGSVWLPIDPHGSQWLPMAPNCKLRRKKKRCLNIPIKMFQNLLPNKHLADMVVLSERF